MTSKLLPRLALALALLAAALPAGAPAQSAAPDALEDARALILVDRLDEALAILDELTTTMPDSVDVAFLRAEIAVRQGRPQDAIPLYRAILAGQPHLTRVRLDLARALFLAGDDANASRQFQLVLAEENLPPPVVANIHRFLDQIRARRGWSANLSVAIVPDSNINAKPEEAYWAGLRLLDRPESGVGVSIAAGAEAVLRLPENRSLVFGADSRHTDYPTSRFDSSRLVAGAGPRVTFERGEASARLTIARQWSAGDPFSYGVGVQTSGQYQLSPRLRLDGSTYVERLRHDDAPALDGPRYGVGATATYGLSSSSFVRGSLGWSRVRTEEDSQSSRTWRAGIGYGREFAAGITATFQAEVAYVRHDAPDFFFGERRREVRRSLNATMLKRDLTLLGFAPALSYDFTDTDSSIDVFGYTRHQVTLAFTRVF